MQWRHFYKLMLTRRDFFYTGAAALAAQTASAIPWYKRVTRLGQTNITERDPTRYDIAWWREYWKRTRDSGRHRQCRRHRRLLSEQVSAAASRGVSERPRSVRRTRQGGARGWSDRAGPDGFEPHRGRLLPRASRLVCATASGEPYRAEDKYVTCVNSPYYDEYLPGVLTEIIERSIRRVSPTIAGAGWGATASATAKTARASFATKPAKPRCRRSATGKIPFTGSGSTGTMRGASRSGT